jgi:2-polyprenyl-3-methyl-5-hydroxy-6-metoxy-1,4-benzoquinol methylase
MDIKELEIFSKTDKISRHPWETVRIRAIKRLLKPVLRHETKKGSVLDVGCGDAYVIQQLAACWPLLDYIGVDLAFNDDNIETIRKASPSLKDAAFYSNLSDVQQCDTVRVALLLDVLEHIEKDQDLLTEVASRLPQRGYVLITVPAFQKLYCRHDKWLGHFRRYSRRELRDRIQKAGLTPVASGYFFSALLIPRVAHKIMESTLLKNTGHAPKGIGQWKYGKLFGRIVDSLLYWNVCMDIGLSKLGFPLPGLSVFSLCKK